MALASLPRSFYRIREVAQQQCNTLSLGQLMRTTSSFPSSLQHTGQWLKDALPVRFARRIEDFLQLPHVVVSDPNINHVLGTYLETFEKVSEFRPIRLEEDEAEFCRVIKEQLSKQNSGTRLVAEGYRDVRRLYPAIRLDRFLHDHFCARIATRILMDNYVEMRYPKPGFVGIVCQGMRPLEIVREATTELSFLTSSIYGCAPEVEFRGNLECVLDYIPRHVKYMVRELLKNAFRATIERHLRNGSGATQIPPVVIELQQGDVHVIIKISDQGGGMPKHIQREAWEYGWTTVDTAADSAVAGTGRSSELAGYGFGLPLTRLHAQYFGGDVFMQALPGHGTDMYLILTHLQEGTPSTEIDDLSTVLYQTENATTSVSAAP